MIQVQCVCGDALVSKDPNAKDPTWVHKVHVTDCLTPTPDGTATDAVEGVELADGWNAVGRSLEFAAGEMADLREQMDAVDATMRRMEERLTAPAVVRRATLDQVWDRLVHSGEIAAARIVMDMIKRVVDTP